MIIRIKPKANEVGPSILGAAFFGWLLWLTIAEFTSRRMFLETTSGFNVLMMAILAVIFMMLTGVCIVEAWKGLHVSATLEKDHTSSPAPAPSTTS